MNCTKKIFTVFLVFVFLLILVKGFNFLVGLLTSTTPATLTSNQLQTTRSILLSEFAPNLDELVMPTNEYMIETQSLEQKGYRLRTDKDGFILGPADFAETNKNKAVDVVFFGGSTTECIYVDEEYRFPYLLSRTLRRNDGQYIRVLNGGRSANHSLHSLFSYLAKGIVYKPRYAVLMEAVNDVAILSKTLSYWNAPVSRRLVQQTTIDSMGLLYWNAKALKDVFLSNIWLNTRHRLADKVERVSRSDEWIDFRDKKIDLKEIENILESDFKAALKSFVAVTRAWGIEPVLMTQPNRLNEADSFSRTLYEKRPQPISYDEFVRLYRLANDIVREVSRDERVLLIDLDKKIEGSSAFVYDEIHLNQRGSKLVADIIAKTFLEHNPKYFNN